MPICEGCAAAYDETFRFCPQCGRPKPEAQKIAIAIEVSGKHHDFDCPLCGDAGSVQKVSAIVSGNTNVSRASLTTSGTNQVYAERSGEKIARGDYASTTYSSQKSQSVLAAKLTMPPPPDKPNRISFDAAWPPGLIIGAAYIGAVFLTWPLGEWIDLGDFWSGALPFLCFAPLVTGGALWGYLSLMNRLKNSDGKFNAAMEDYEQGVETHKKLKEQWDELYYCHKHDVVYTISKRELAQVDHAIAACARWASS